MTRTFLALAIAAVVCGCDGEGATDESGQAVLSSAGLVGAWRGTKTYFDSSGNPVAWATGWPLEIVAAD